MMSRFISKPVAIPAEWQGLSRNPVNEPQRVDMTPDTDFFSRTYEQNVQKALDSHFDSTLTSGQSSPTITVTQSPLSFSRGGWTTDRSSLDSSCSMDDFDKLATTAVSQHFEEINSVLFEGLKDTSSLADSLVQECREWSSQFPHLRVLGKQVVQQRETGFCHISPPPSNPTSSLTSSSSDSSETRQSSKNQRLSVVGRHIPVVEASDVFTTEPDHSTSQSAVTEEVIEEEGVYEDIIAVDSSDLYDNSTDFKRTISPRRTRKGFPPITPSACVKDSIMSGIFDHVWQDTLSRMRELLRKYALHVSGSKGKVTYVSSSGSHSSSFIPKEVSLIMDNQKQSAPQGGTSTHEKWMRDLLHIKSIPIKYRSSGTHLSDQSDNHALSSYPTLSTPSMMSSHSRSTSGQPVSQRWGRMGRLAPINKTTSFDEDKGSSSPAESLRVQGHNMIGNESFTSPPSHFQRNGSLPPLEIERTQHRKIHSGYRAVSASTDTKDQRLFLPYKDRQRVDQSRPNTTNAMRVDSSFIGSQGKRSSTALGYSNSLSIRHVLHANRPLDIRGSGLQPSYETVHTHPDIQEDQQESAAENLPQTQEYS